MERGEREARAVEDEAIAMLRQLNEDYIAAVQASDVRRFEDILADDFLNTNPDGSLVDRAGFLAQIARPAGISDLRAHDVRIRRFGDAAIVHARTTCTKANGQPGTGRYTDVCVCADGRRRCVAAHVTRN
ncbi:MAG TPA: nuclear transport factor 2 family protein [Burkholderiales bacterium]